MTSYSWIKLYHEVLHDPKMGRLTDNLWRRTIEVFLLAGEVGNDGALPPLEDMAWTLRLSIEELEANLTALSKYDIVAQTPYGWSVTHFSKRQAPIDVNERVSAYRDRVKKHDYYAPVTDEKQEGNEDVTNRYRDTEKSKIQNKNRSEKNRAEKPPTPPQIQAYRSVAHRYPNKGLYELICTHVKDDPDSLELFKKIITGWIAMGWNPANINGILEFVDRGEIPHKNGTGKSGNGSTGNGMLDAIRRAQQEPGYGDE